MKTARNKTLRDFMSQKQLKAMKGLPTFHCNCLEKTGVAPPRKDRQGPDEKGPVVVRTGKVERVHLYSLHDHAIHKPERRRI